VCITFVVPIVMCFVLIGQMKEFFGDHILCKIIPVAVLVIFGAWTYFVKNKK